AYILLGDIECENKNLDDAISFYSRAIKIDRKCFQGWINRANCYKEKGLLLQAEKDAKQAIKLNPKISHGHEIIAEIMLKNGNAIAALNSIKIAAKMGQNRHVSYYILSKILMKKGDYAGSKEALMKAIKIKSDFSKAYFDLLLLAQKHDNTRVALKILSQIAANCQCKFYCKCIGILAKYFREKADIKHLRIVLNKLIQATPPRERISISCFRAYCGLGKYSEAFKIAEGLVSGKNIDNTVTMFCNPWLSDIIAPQSFWRKQFLILSNTEVKGKYKIWRYFYLMVLQGMLNYDKSLIEIKKICSQFTGDYRWMRFPLACHLFRHDLKQALKELQVIIDCVPQDGMVRCKNGEGLVCIGKATDGIKQFEIAIGINKNERGDIEAWKGEMYLMTGEYKKALKSLEIAVQLNAPFALCWRGAALFKLGHIQEGLKDLKYVVKKLPEDIEAMMWMAEILRTVGKVNESFEHLNFILKSRPDYDFALVNRALLYYAIGDYASMRKDFSRINIKLKSVILDRLKIKPITNFSHGQIYKILKGGLEMAKGNRRQEKYFLRIQFPEYTNIDSTIKIP
ncbi:MAG: hypothetical protein L6420_06065, partial [Elusimicrobia bacterium]|nr:hypothetical protein [Elusimicrobiota bacterium]